LASRFAGRTYIAAVLDTQEKLEVYLPTLRSAEWIAVDTEADSLHAYPEKICLIQISTDSGDRLVDTLAKLGLGPLLDALSRHELIMHGADYDLRLFRRHHSFAPRAVFDTMLAARLLGLRQFSLSHLVQAHLGVKLEKGPQKANWAMRPLTLRMESYARNDTHYLRALEKRLRRELETKGRLSWHRESCERLIQDAGRNPPEDPEGWRLKGSAYLSRSGLAVLRELWRWREREAIASNRPPFFVLSHDALVAIATAASHGRTVESALPHHVSDRRRAGILKAVAKGLEVELDHCPRPLRAVARRQSEGEKKRAVELKRRRDAIAGQLGLDPTLIASRAVLSDLAHNWDKYAPTLMKWQRELLESS
jgi:ribonuclease D